MTLLIHLILTTLATIFGWDLVRRLSPVRVPGVVARVLIAVLAVVLWTLCPVNLLVGGAIVGVLMIVGQWIAVEPHWLWGSTLLDAVLKRKQLRSQDRIKRVVEKKMTLMGNRFEVKDKVGQRIKKL